MDCLRSCWRDDVLLLSCSDKFLRLFLQLLSRYSNWLSTGLSAQKAGNSAANSGSEWAISASPDDFLYLNMEYIRLSRWDYTNLRLAAITGFDMGKDPILSSLIEGFIAGGFIYIVLAGVLAKMNNDTPALRKTAIQLTSLMLGITVALCISLVE